MDPARLGELRGPFAVAAAAGCRPIELDRELALNVCWWCCCCARDGGGREGLVVVVVLLRGLVPSLAPPRPTPAGEGVL